MTWVCWRGVRCPAPSTCPGTPAVSQPSGWLVGLDVLWAGPTSAWAHGNAGLSTEMESTGKGLGPRPQDALLGLSHLLRLKAGMDLGTKRGHKLSVRFYPSPDLPPLEKAPCELQYR